MTHMDIQTRPEQWDPDEGILRREVMDRRIKNTVSARGWQEVVAQFLMQGKPMETLNAIELGCGSGTFSLTFALLGASVTLVDFNPRVLEIAENIYRMYGCSARCVGWDCATSPPARLIDRFDLSSSIGVAEHFTGAKRLRFMDSHRSVLKQGGFAFATVPNSRSPAYGFIRRFREATGTWNLDVEVAFTDAELVAIARQLGFRQYRVIGNGFLLKDMAVHARGFVSALVDLLPPNVARQARAWHRGSGGVFRRNNKNEPGGMDAQAVCRDAVQCVRNRLGNSQDAPWADAFCSAIALIAVR